jgi:hypothetical protein
MSDEPPDATPEEIALEEEIRRFEAEAAFHQSNILPMDYAMNLGRFYGLLIRASRPRNQIERLGLIFMGISWIASGLPNVPISWLLLPLGLKLLWTACRPSQREPADAD